MPTSAERLSGVRAKIERAKHHVNEFDAGVGSFRSAHPYGVFPQYDPKTGDTLYVARCPSQPPLELAVIAGEAIHQLRSSLGHLAWQLVEAAGGTPDDQTEFPIHQTPPKDKAAIERKIQGMSPAAKDLIRALQPYQSGNNGLWKLHKLDNTDKHRLLFTAVYAIATAYVRHGGAWVLASFRDAPARVMMQDGIEVIRFLGAPEAQKEFNAIFEVAFREPQIVQGEPVLPLLRQLTGLVESVVNQFVPFL